MIVKVASCLKLWSRHTYSHPNIAHQAQRAVIPHPHPQFTRLLVHEIQSQSQGRCSSAQNDVSTLIWGCLKGIQHTRAHILEYVILLQ